MAGLLVLLLSFSPVFADIIGSVDNPAPNAYSPPGPEPLESGCKGTKKGEYETGDVREFMKACLDSGVSQSYCENLTHPNKASIKEFRCTYPGQPHILIPPDKSLWENGIQAAKLIQETAEKEGFCVKEIYNWYRPEPYNKNVGGAPSRHPNSTAVDSEYCTEQDAKKAAQIYCEKYARKEIYAMGSYDSRIRLHIGIKPELHTTWGPWACGGKKSPKARNTKRKRK